MWIGLAILAALILAAYAIPEDHVMAVSREYDAPPERIYGAIIETGRMLFAENIPNQRLVTADAGAGGKGYSGTWTFDIKPTPSGSRLTITERGRVFNPLFRLIGKYVIGYDRTIRNYQRDLETALSK